MAEQSADENPGRRGRASRKNSTRAAILDAARRLAARDGAEAVTLGRVAAEAGFAPPAVYAFFTSKDELHLAVAADDLERVASAMRGEEAVAEDTAGEEGEPEPRAAEIIAFQPAAAAEETSDTETAAEGSEAGSEELSAAHAEDAAADHPEQVESALEEADTSRAVEQPNVPPETPLAQISLAEIEQAMGVVLAGGEDFLDVPADAEMVPDAFPEEHDTPAQAELPIAPQGLATNVSDVCATELKPFVERRIQPDRRSTHSGFRVPWRRSRPEEEEAQAPLPLEAAATQNKTDQAIAQLQEAVARLEERPVDSWLERRLRVFERTLADLEARMEKAERDSNTALVTVSESFKALEERLSETLDGTSRQVGDSEQRHRAIAADLRLHVKDLSGRLAAVERSLSRFLSAEDGELMPSRPSRVQVEEEPQPEPVPARPAPAPRALHEPQGESYLSVARRAANSAAAEAERSRVMAPLSYLKMSPAGAAGVSVSRRSLQIVAGALTLVVLVIVAAIWLRGGPSQSPVRVPVAAEVAPKDSPDARVAALAKAGNAKAELVVALKLLNGDGVATDVPSAAFWLKKSAAAHEPVADYWLGTLYERGRGVSKNSAKAMQAYEAAANAGNAKAMYRLGVGYAEGWNGEADYVEAAHWFTKAAALGVIDAQFNLGVLYERGEGVPENPLEAFKWYAIAAAQGDAESRARIDALAAGLAPDKVAEVQAEAAKFRPQEPDPAANVEPSVQSVAAAH